MKTYLDDNVQEAAAALSALDQPLEPIHLMALAQTLAVKFYRMHEYKVPPNYNLRDSSHPQEYLMWQMGCESVALLRATDMEDVQNQYDEEQSEAIPMLSQKIKRLRLDAGIPKSALAKKVGVSDVTIGYWESGNIKSMGADKLINLAGAFGISVSELLDDPRKDKPGLEWAAELLEEIPSTEILERNISHRLEQLNES